MRRPKLSLLALALALACSAAAAQTQRPVRMMIGFPPGGAVDVLARVFAERLAEALARPVVVEARPGANGQIAAEVVKAAAPDGGTLMLAPDAAVIIRPLTMRKPAFDPFADFAPVAHAGHAAQALAVAASVPAKDLREFAAWIKANPGSAAFSSPGAGGSTHFFGLMIAQELGIQLRVIPYKGSGPAVADLAAGHVASSVGPLGTMLGHARAGRIRVIGVSGAQRSPSLPDAPSFSEQGYPALTMEAWFGIFAPAGTPQDLVARLNGIILQAERTPAVRERMRNLDLEIREMTPAEFGALMRADYDRWAPIIKASGFTAESE